MAKTKKKSAAADPEKPDTRRMTRAELRDLRSSDNDRLKEPRGETDAESTGDIEEQ